MLPSGNDAALAIANHVAGSESGFVALMNAKARELSLDDTQFQNPHGLHAAGHYSTVYDMTMLARYGMQKHPFFVRLSAAKYWEVAGRRSYELYNLNRLLTQYKGGDGVKVGYTEEAGKTFVGSATRDGHRVYVGLMKSQNLWEDTPPLLDWAFENFTWPSR
jgi:D-alanyl-D-alanine carboxypeptidase